MQIEGEMNAANIDPGIAYMVTAFTFVKTIDLYHLHLMYDTVSFVG